MRVGVDGELLQHLIKAHGGVNSFLGHWNSVNGKADDHPDNATIYRWIKGETVPKNGDLYLRLAGLLDVDPFALLAVADDDILAVADELLRVVQHTAPAPSWLQFVHAFFGRQIAWPPGELASVYFSRSWHVGEFRHEAAARKNFYATVVLHQAANGAQDRSRVFHFAYRHPAHFHARWLQYGIVRLKGQSIALHHIGGHIDRLTRAGSEEPVRVETWFGEGPALFRIASLHPFSHSIEEASDDTTDKVRFPA